MKTRHLLLLLLASATSMSTSRASEPQDSTIEHSNLYIYINNVWAANPALRYDAYATSRGELGFYLDKRHEHEAFVMQQGNTEQSISIGANSYRRLAKNAHNSTVVWGNAAYETGKRKHVEWNAAADWATIYPFVLADTIGGDRNTERYSFQGGCATRLGLWTIGEQLTFRAEHEWSTRDPRMRGIVTDLDARLGVSRTAIGHNIAIGGSLKLYKQTNSVEFYREEGRVAEYQMSGMGNWYERFSGTNDRAYYKSTGYAIDLGVTPERGNGGLLLALDYGYQPLRRILSSLNSLPIQRLYVTNWGARIGWKAPTINTKRPTLNPETSKLNRQNSTFNTTIWAGLKGEKRRGDEIIGGESTSDEYVVRGYLTMYRNRLTDVYCGGSLLWTMGKSNLLTLSVQGGRQQYTSDYAFPHQSLRFCKNHVGAEVQWQTFGKRWSLSTNADIGYYNNVSGELIAAEEASYESPLADDVALAKSTMTERCTAQMLASYMQLGLSMRAEWAPQFMRNFGFFASVGANYRSNDTLDTNKGYAIRASLGITF